MPYLNEELVLAVLQDLQTKLTNGGRISVTNALFELRDIIVEEYAVDSPLQTYKDLWVIRIRETASQHNFELLTRSPSWIRLDPLLLNKSSENTAASPSSSPSSSTGLSYFLTAEDKEFIKKMYENLDPSKMWTLSTGTIVEKKMEELANKCIVEHPCHSLIMNADDDTWSDYFTEEELAEIREHKAVEFIPPPSELKEYLDNLVQKDDADEMHDEISEVFYKPKFNPACHWARKTLLEGLDLHNSGFFNSLSNHIERDFVTRVWRMMLTSFNYSRITAREEIYSDAKRSDHLYSFNEYELGILESDQENDEYGTQQYKDAFLTSPKTMKDLLFQATEYNPHLIRSIRIPCLITSALEIKLLILDSPEGYVCRISSTESYKYPSCFVRGFKKPAYS